MNVDEIEEPAIVVYDGCISSACVSTWCVQERERENTTLCTHNTVIINKWIPTVRQPIHPIAD